MSGSTAAISARRASSRAGPPRRAPNLLITDSCGRAHGCGAYAPDHDCRSRPRGRRRSRNSPQAGAARSPRSALGETCCSEIPTPQTPRFVVRSGNFTARGWPDGHDDFHEAEPSAWTDSGMSVLPLWISSRSEPAANARVVRGRRCNIQATALGRQTRGGMAGPTLSRARGNLIRSRFLDRSTLTTCGAFLGRPRRLR